MESEININKTSYSNHIIDLYNIIRKSSIFFAAFCVIWSFQISDLMTLWIDIIPISDGNYENLAIYGPYE